MSASPLTFPSPSAPPRRKTPTGEAPKYVQLAAILRKRMVGGELNPGDQLPSFSQMTAQFSVTSTTVERVYGLLEREGLIERQHGKGVFVALQRRATHCLGVWNTPSESLAPVPYWARLIEGVQDAAHAAGYEVLLLNRAARVMSWDKVDAILTPVNDLHHLDGVPSSLPRVAMVSTLRGVASVTSDDIDGIDLAVEHLLELGHRRISYLVCEGPKITQMRLSAYRCALERAQIEVESNWIGKIEFSQHLQSFRTAGHAAMQKWLKNGWAEMDCTALLCQNDESALGALQALHEAGIRVPDDVSLVGYDGTELCDFVRPTLTSVVVPLHEIGCRAVGVLLQQIQSGVLNDSGLVLPVRLKIGGSTGPLRS